LFEDERSSHSRSQAANEPVQNTTTKFEEAKQIRETSNSTSSEKEDNKSDTSDHSSSKLEASRLSKEDTNSSGHGDVIRSLQSLRERVTMLEKENEAIRLNSRSKNSRKREFSAQ
jgi:hypothetical protein